MFYLSEKNPLAPRVILVQALLRYKGIDVQITGKWDQQTAEGVAKYRTQLNMNPQGFVDKDVFFNIIQNTKLKVIDSIDASGGEPSRTTAEQVRKAGVAPLMNPRKVGEGVKYAVDLIINRAQDHRIALLRFHAHGNHGVWISIALGDPVHANKKDYAKMKADFYSYIDYSHFERHRPVLSRLRPLFAPFGSVELNNCKIGNQKELLLKLANTWEVPVSGGYGKQYTGEDCINEYGERVNPTFEMEGNIFTAYPNDVKLNEWAAKVENLLPNLPSLVTQVQSMIPGFNNRN